VNNSTSAGLTRGGRSSAARAHRETPPPGTTSLAVSAISCARRASSRSTRASASDIARWSASLRSAEPTRQDNTGCISQPAATNPTTRALPRRSSADNLLGARPVRRGARAGLCRRRHLRGLGRRRRGGLGRLGAVLSAGRRLPTAPALGRGLRAAALRRRLRAGAVRDFRLRGHALLELVLAQTRSRDDEARTEPPPASSATAPPTESPTSPARLATAPPISGNAPSGRS
jgi:hypothetical protein